MVKLPSMMSLASTMRRSTPLYKPSLLLLVKADPAALSECNFVASHWATGLGFGGMRQFAN